MTPSNYNNNLGHSLVDFMSLNNLFQFNNIVNTNGNLRIQILDLVISNLRNVNVFQPLDLLSKLVNFHPQLLITNLLACDSLENLHPNSRQIHNCYIADCDYNT